MKHVSWMGWLLAGLLLLDNAAVGLTAPAAASPLEGHLLQRSDGTWYVYHDGLKLPATVADLGDAVIQAIPTASPDQWTGLFSGTRPATPAGAPLPAPAGEYTPAPPDQPMPFPGYS
jgi:hypothetical protein